MAPTLENTKYQRLAQSLREKIRSGELQPEDRLPSFSAMRLQYGATTTTVERVYSILEQEGLVKREKGRGIFVAQPHAVRAKGIIGITGLGDTFGTGCHPWGTHLLKGIRDAAGHAGKEILLYRHLPNSAIQWEHVDGILNIDTHIHHILPHLPIGIPFVSALTKVPQHVSVVADEAGGLRAAIEHLIALGHRQIAYLIMQTKPDIPVLQQRVAAYHHTMHELGIAPHPRWLRHLHLEDSMYFQESGYNSMAQWLADDWHELGCTALLAHNDDTAIGAMQALQQAGIRVPEDVSVVGFDGTEIGKYCTPHLTSVKLPLEEIGAQAMKLLLQLIREEPVSFSTLELPARLIVRHSTASPNQSKERF